MGGVLSGVGNLASSIVGNVPVIGGLASNVIQGVTGGGQQQQQMPQQQPQQWQQPQQPMPQIGGYPGMGGGYGMYPGMGYGSYPPPMPSWQSGYPGYMGQPFPYQSPQGGGSPYLPFGYQPQMMQPPQWGQPPQPQRPQQQAPQAPQQPQPVQGSPNGTHYGSRF